MEDECGEITSCNLLMLSSSIALPLFCSWSLSIVLYWDPMLFVMEFCTVFCNLNNQSYDFEI